jgi:anti-anti-sigma factor
MKVEIINDCGVITLDSPFGMYECPEFSEKADELLSKNKHLLIDFYHTKYIDSSGLGNLMNTQSLVNRKGLKMYICNTNEITTKFFEMFKLDARFRFYSGDIFELIKKIERNETEM